VISISHLPTKRQSEVWPSFMYHQAKSYKIGILNLATSSKYRKWYEAVRFLPKAMTFLSLKQLRMERTFHIGDRAGHIIGLSHGDLIYPIDQKGVEKISHLLIALEDRRFYSHHGIDIRGIIRSLLRNIIARRIVQGGSTITQQLVRNTLLTHDRSVARKLLEIFLALIVERYYSKAEILYLYCQLVYLGGGTRGFSGAAKLLYRKPMSSLNYTQTCGLLGLLHLPSVTYPKNSTKNFFCRQKFVTQLLLRKTANSEENAVIEQNLNPINVERMKRPRLSHILEYLIEHEFGAIRPNVKKVVLTINSTVQSVLDQVLQEASCAKNISQATAVILDNSTGEIIAESAWQNGMESEFSAAYFGRIQPGSTFKTFAILAALEQGFNLDLVLESSLFESSFLKDRHNTLWKVRNYGEIYRGHITLKDAFVYSDNTAFARLVELLDLEGLIYAYNRFGLSEANKGHPSIVLGGTTPGVSLLTLASAYRAIARNGVMSAPRFIKYVELTEGNEILAPRHHEEYHVADYNVIVSLKEALKYSGLSFNGLNISGKTGTTSSGSLFAGYDSNISLAIWLGFRTPASERDPKVKTGKQVLEHFVTKMLGYRSNLFAI